RRRPPVPGWAITKSMALVGDRILRSGSPRADVFWAWTSVSPPMRLVALDPLEKEAGNDAQSAHVNIDARCDDSCDGRGSNVCPDRSDEHHASRWPDKGVDGAGKWLGDADAEGWHSVRIPADDSGRPALVESHRRRLQDADGDAGDAAPG